MPERFPKIGRHNARNIPGGYFVSPSMSPRNRIAVIVTMIVCLAIFVVFMERSAPPKIALTDGAYTVAMRPGAKLALDVASGGVEIDTGDVPQLKIEYNGFPERAKLEGIERGARATVDQIHAAGMACLMYIGPCFSYGDKVKQQQDKLNSMAGPGADSAGSSAATPSATTSPGP